MKVVIQALFYRILLTINIVNKSKDRKFWVKIQLNWVVYVI